MPVVIQKHVLFKDIDKPLPAKYRGWKKPKLSDNEYVTLILFPMKVVRSRVVKHALEKVLPTTENIIAYGQNFTKESIDVMKEMKVWTVMLRYHDWTDSRLDEIQAIGRVKRPLITKKERREWGK